jgi:hypothetical protein
MGQSHGVVTWGSHLFASLNRQFLWKGRFKVMEHGTQGTHQRAPAVICKPNATRSLIYQVLVFKTTSPPPSPLFPFFHGTQTLLSGFEHFEHWQLCTVMSNVFDTGDCICPNGQSNSHLKFPAPGSTHNVRARRKCRQQNRTFGKKKNTALRKRKTIGKVQPNVESRITSQF